MDLDAKSEQQARGFTQLVQELEGLRRTLIPLKDEIVNQNGT